MTAKMPMSGSPEKRRDCIAQLALRSPIFRLALNYVTTLIRLRQRLRNWGCAPAVPPDARPSSKHQRRAGRKTRPSNLVLRKRRNEVPEKLNSFFWFADFTDTTNALASLAPLRRA